MPLSPVVQQVTHSTRGEAMKENQLEAVGQRPPPARWGRRGWLLTTLALGVALIVSALANWRNVRSLESTLNRGQAEMLHGVVRAVLGPPGQEQQLPLDSLVEAYASSGLRYIALLGINGVVLASGGEAAPEPLTLPAPEAGPPRPQQTVLSDRLRYTFGAGGPQRSPGGSRDGRPELEWPPGGPPPGGPPQLNRPGGRFDRGPGPRVITVIEFEPIHAARLGRQATLALVLSVLGAGVLTTAALLFFQLSRRYEEAQLAFEERRRLSALGEMSAVMAHEIRNPLASLKGNAQLLAEQLAAPSAERRRADRVVHEAKRLESLTTDLLDFARSGTLALESVDPVELARAVASDVGMNVELDVDDAPSQWQLDPMRFRRVLENVLRNAVQASPADVAPSLRIAEENGALNFVVRDRGAGVPTEQHERIFDPFFTTRTQGTGLGLSVARRLVEMHGGRISAHNHADGGAEFRISLPRPNDVK